MPGLSPYRPVPTVPATVRTKGFLLLSSTLCCAASLLGPMRPSPRSLCSVLTMAGAGCAQYRCSAMLGRASGMELGAA